MDTLCPKCGRKRNGSRHKWCKRCLAASRTYCRRYFESRKMTTTTLGICYRCLSPKPGRIKLLCVACAKSQWRTELKRKKESPDNDGKSTGLQQ